MKETLHFTIGPLLGEHLLEIAQTNISEGNSQKGIDTYVKGLCGFTKEYALMCLKNKAVLITGDDNESVMLKTDPEIIKSNAHNIFDWKSIINKRFEDICGIRENIIKAETEFVKLYYGNIRDYSIIGMMKRYFNDEQLSVIGIHTIAARICGNAECKICDKGSSNPWSVWERLEGKMENYEDTPDVPKYEQVLYWTVRYNKLIRMLHKEYLKFENIYLFLVENEFIERPYKIELFLENTIKTLVEFTDTSQGYYHPLCNTGLYSYKKTLYEDISNTHFGMEYIKNGVIKKNIMDGYDAGYLSPEGDFYGADGITSAMLHMNLADALCNKMFKEELDKFNEKVKKDNEKLGIYFSKADPEEFLNHIGFMKIHHDECYGFYSHYKDSDDYLYCPTDIQIKVICDYADKYYGGKFYTEANAFGRSYHSDPFTTYAVRQMDEFKLHEIFSF